MKVIQSIKNIFSFAVVLVDRLSISPYLRCTHISLHLSVTYAVYNGAVVGLLILLCRFFFLFA